MNSCLFSKFDVKNLFGYAIGFICLVTGHQTMVDDDRKPEKSIRKITPGQVIVPFEWMRRIWGELLTVDLETRTVTFHAE